MKRRNDLFPVMLALLVSFLALLAGGIQLNKSFRSRLSEERRNQLKELTAQVSTTFQNALDFSWSNTLAAEGIFQKGTYATSEEVSAAAGEIFEELGFSEGEEILMFLDKGGRCFDAEGAKGIWGDFDQVVGSGDRYTFISDSVTYDGVHWAFAKKLEEPVTTEDGNTVICYVVLLRAVESMEGYYFSDAYSDVCETYILKENGTRMYDSVKADDTISSYNLYKVLESADSSGGESFDLTLETLAAENVAVNFCTLSNGAEYGYALAEISGYEVVLLYLIPAEAVATSTVSMVSSMTSSLFAVLILVMALSGLTLFIMMRLVGSRRLYEQKERSLREIEKKNEELEKTTRSLEAARASAESALDIARSANRAKSNFLSNMSHDIRTPLNAIIGFQKLLERDADNPESVRMYSRKIGVSGQHLLSLINDILDMSRIESGKTTLNQDYFVVDALLGDISDIVREQASEKEQEFSLETEGTAGLTVLGDRLRLSQILMNLLSNAVKYTQTGGRVLLRVVRLEGENRNLATLRIVVRDNGIGMNEEFQKRIFEPFEREYTSTNTGIQGTGLGMAITKNLVDLMGGIILVDSIPGKGSTFTLELAFPVRETDGAVGGAADREETVPGSGADGTVTGEAVPGSGTGGTVSGEALPGSDTDDAVNGKAVQRSSTGRAVAGEALPERGAGAAVSLTAEEKNVLKGRHFLIAEDNEINAEIIGELLKMEEATCVIAQNGERAVELFCGSGPGTFDAIFMDIQMPVMDGYAAARAIRGSGHPDAVWIPIAAMTANAFAEDVQRALEAGMNAHIAKPVDMVKVKEFMANEMADGRNPSHGKGRIQ